MSVDSDDSYGSLEQYGYGYGEYHDKSAAAARARALGKSPTSANAGFLCGVDNILKNLFGLRR